MNANGFQNDLSTHSFQPPPETGKMRGIRAGVYIVIYRTSVKT
jgi:hypothetical protein